MEIKNEWKRNRGGFVHISSLYVNDELLCTARCQYVNRTWEMYSYQSSMKRVVSMAIEDEIKNQKNIRGIKRLTQALRLDIIDKSILIQQLNEKYKKL